MDDELHIRAIAAEWYNGVHLLVKSIGSHGTSIVMEKHEPGAYMRPTITIGNDKAQILMDDLWSAGIRPTEGTGSAGSLRATEKHLSDMRKIVSNRLGVAL